MKLILQKFKYRRIILAIADAFIVAVSAIISSFILFALNDIIGTRTLWASVVMSCFTCFGGLSLSGTYNKLRRHFSQKDYMSCVYGVLIGFSLFCVFAYILLGNIPLRFELLHTCIALIGICLFRFFFKTTLIDLTNTGQQETKGRRTILVGGGQACRILLQELRRLRQSSNPEETAVSVFEPVCIIDDDRNKNGQTLLDVQIVGTTAEIQKYIDEMNIEQIIFCIPSCQENERKHILDICTKTNLPVKVIPCLSNLLFDETHVTLLNQVRDINIEDLLGRDPISFDNQNLSSLLSGKVCMVTGGGGSIGSELVRQIAKYNPKQVIILDICENYAYDIQQEMIMEYGTSLDLVTIIASVRDYYRMNQIFKKYKPDIVFHAAAHKHVPLMEENPMEAIKNNVIGTFNIATLAQFHDVKKFVMISTDKAVNPTNVMGASKRCCEMIMQYLAKQTDCHTEFVTTRFGNVLDSHGSVIPKFKKQIEEGRSVTVTHPDIIRYFMTISEAVSLVMEAAAIAHGGEIFVLDMGEPVRIVTLAENLIHMYGKVPYKDVKIEFTGLRPGEKIKEELLMNEEGLKRTKNKLIFIGKQIDIEPEQFIDNLRRLRDAAQDNNDEIVVQALHDMVPTFKTPAQFNAKYIASTE